MAESPLLVLLGPTASGKSALAVKLAERFGGEVISCDSVAMYRGLDIGSAKPTRLERERVLHYGLDVLDPIQPSTAGDYARMARRVIQQIATKGRLPMLVGGTGLYLRATLDGLALAPARNDALRERLRAHGVRRGAGSLHRLLERLDASAARQIHPHDTPKLIRSLEMTLLGGRPQSEQWADGAEPLSGYRILRIGLNPPRPALYEKINDRAALMFTRGLLQETAAVVAQYGTTACALGSLGYAQALRVLQGQQGLEEAIKEAQQGHRNYAKRQLTWFRRDKEIVWLQGFGAGEEVQKRASRLIEEHLIPESPRG